MPEHFGGFRDSTRIQEGVELQLEGFALGRLAPVRSRSAARRRPKTWPDPAGRSRAKGIGAAGTGAVCGRARWKPGWPSGWPRSRWGTAAARWRYPPFRRGCEMPAARISSRLGAGQRQHHIHVVDHQIQHHVHVQAARAEEIHAVDLEEQRQRGALLQCQHGGVEALQVPDLQDAAARARRLRSGGRRRRDRGRWAFRPARRCRPPAAAADLRVRGGGSGDDGGVHLAGEFAEVRERLGCVWRAAASAARPRSISTMAASSARAPIRGPRGSGCCAELPGAD